MLNATTYLSQDEQQQVEAAIRDAEQHTSAEMVAVIATESGRYDRAESIVGLLGSVLGLIVLNSIASSWNAFVRSRKRAFRAATNPGSDRQLVGRP